MFVVYLGLVPAVISQVLSAKQIQAPLVLGGNISRENPNDGSGDSIIDTETLGVYVKQDPVPHH